MRSLVWLLLPLLFADAAGAAEIRHVAIRIPEGFSFGAEFERMGAWARREGVELEVRPEGSVVAAGWETAHLSVLPAAEALRRSLARFPVQFEEKRFLFDGRAFGGREDAIALRDPAAPAETFILGNTRQAVLRLAATRLFGRGEPADYEVVSGELSKQGRFFRSVGASTLAIDRSSDRDEIASRDEFFRAQKSERRGGVEWKFRESERVALARWEPVLKRFLHRPAANPLAVRLFPDPVSKGRYTGSSRPADLERDGRTIRVNLDISAPGEPDLVSPVLAGAALAAEDLRLLSRPLLLQARGARACGRWWGRDVAGFAAFAEQARVEPSVREVLTADEEVSPVLAVGAAASWIEAGARSEGETSVARSLAGDDRKLEEALRRWREKAVGQKSAVPARRRLPQGFLRGISYAMTNTIDGSYASPRSRQTLDHLARISVNSISVMPYGFMRDAGRPTIAFIHRHPAGETDEGTVRAVSDARALGMTALVKPQIWLPGGVFVGAIAMGGEEDWRRWFDLYRRFIVHHAVVAEAAGAALFCVGTEMLGTQVRAQEWKETIASVRQATGAPLLYASNWAAGAPRVPFWDALDAVGVDFYDPLSKDPDASDAALELGVRAAVRPLVALARQTGKPVLFAEAGYPPVRAAWITPNEEGSGRPSAPGDAARAVAAVFRSLEKETWWKGVYWWKVFSGGREAHSQEQGFNLLGSPSEKAIAEGFARVSRERSP
ncbi:MAG: glycoside hydrolase family 113 [Thermoanaerobaculia bacterium]